LDLVLLPCGILQNNLYFDAFSYLEASYFEATYLEATYLEAMYLQAMSLQEMYLYGNNS
jgi:hypothetical protein